MPNRSWCCIVCSTGLCSFNVGFVQFILLLTACHTHAEKISACETPNHPGHLTRLFFPPPQIKTEKSGLARETTRGDAGIFPRILVAHLWPRWVWLDRIRVLTIMISKGRNIAERKQSLSVVAARLDNPLPTS